MMHSAKLCVFRGNPADVDGITLTLVIRFLVFLVLQSGLVLTTVWMATYHMSFYVHTVGDEIAQVLYVIPAQLIVALCLYVVLHIRRMPQNFRYTLSSYLGVCIVITFASLVLVLASVLISSHDDLSVLFDRKQNYLLVTGMMRIVVSTVYLVSAIWKILVFGYILYKSLEIKFWQGGILAIMLIYSPQILVSLFPDQPVFIHGDPIGLGIFTI